MAHRDALSGSRRGSALFAAALTACSTGAEPPPGRLFSETGELIALSGGRAGATNACFTCHGLEGEGNGAGVPRLAGLNMGYLSWQMDSYASGLRQHPQMHVIARALSREERLRVSAYYAAMPFVPPGPAATPPPAPALYTRGDPARGLAACADCHGRDGRGVGPGNPPLAGQPAAYLAEQLHQWRRSARRNDAGNVMQVISRRLRPEEVEALSAYAEAAWGLRRPEFAAASRSAHRDDPRNDASAPPRHGAE